MLSDFPADLHLHTCLSPCAEIDMTPRQIIGTAKEKGLRIIAITDHNSAENAAAAERAAQGTGITVLRGMEVTSSEEIHILALFDDVKDIEYMQDIVLENLPSGENNERLYGHQIIVNEYDEVMGFNKRLLIAATKLNTQIILDVIDSLGGLSIASHVDREAFSILSQLGFIPEDLRFGALEFSPRIRRGEAEGRFAALKTFPWVSFSDAHHVADIGKRVTTFTLEEPTLAEMKQALRNSNGRSSTW